jgi:hypothetical protein
MVNGRIWINNMNENDIFNWNEITEEISKQKKFDVLNNTVEGVANSFNRLSESLENAIKRLSENFPPSYGEINWK